MNKIKETDEYKQFPFKLKWAFDGILGLWEESIEKENQLQSKIDGLIDFRPVEELIRYEERPVIWEREKNGWGVVYHIIDSPGEELKISADHLDNWMERNRIIYDKNVEICERNKKAKSIAFSFLKKLGLKEEKYDYVGRSRNKKKVVCDWVRELDKLFITDCSSEFRQIENFAKEEKKKIKDYLAGKEKEERDKKKKEEDEVKEKEKIALIVLMVQKYGLQFNEPIPDIKEVVEELAKKNKYLYLAYKLEQNRGDWNDGYDYAEEGLRFFIYEKEYIGAGKYIDEAIVKDIRSYMHDEWDGDGRCFRDCEWNYSRLYGMAEEYDKQLYDDWAKLKIYID